MLSNFSKFSSLLILTLFISSLSTLLAQDKKGVVSGSLESNSIYYIDDNSMGVTAPYAIGSNNYLKVDYSYQKFSAGLQIEYYPEVLQGFQKELKGIGIASKYLAWKDSNYSITIGDYYEQFGSGLLFRSWEDRQLGHNNSLFGARATFNTSNNLLNAKLIYGIPRDYLKSIGRGYKFGQNLLDCYSSSQIAGADISFMLSDLIMPNSMHSLFIEASAVNRYERASTPAFDTDNYSDLEIPQNLLSYSTRLGYEYGGFSLKFEHIGKGKELYLSHKNDKYELKNGTAQLLELGYSTRGFSAAATLRKLNNMSMLAYRVEDMSAAALPANTLNYIPALCQEQSYMLASFNPYRANCDGEVGGQIDLFYSIARNSYLGGKYGAKIHLNSSMFYTPSYALSSKQNNARLSYRDITVDIEKKWNKRLKTILFVSIQELSPTHGEKIATEAQNIFVMDVNYSFTNKFSLRGELQYLYSQELTKDWVATLVEANFSPKWSIFASDMYNHGDSKLHYYNAGAAYTYSKLRVAASYGRNREGMVCSGGVCRWQPAYTGANLQLSLIF